MTAISFSAAMTNASAAQFRAWGSGISGAFGTAWTAAADTGQIDWGTVAAPGAADTAMGFEMWRMADSLQATAPAVVKIEYGSGTSTNNPAVWLTIGTGSDGAGNVTGVLFPRTRVAIGSATTTVYGAIGSVASGRINVALGATYSSNTYFFAFAIERTHGADGVDTADGLNVLTIANAVRVSQYLPFAGLIPSSYSAFLTVVPPSGGGAWAPDMHVYPIRTWTPGESFPLHCAVSYVSGDFSTGSTIAVVGFDGQTRTYYCVGSPSGQTSYGGTGNIAWRYD